MIRSEYAPKPDTEALLARALGYVRETPYRVTARWVFYRLLQDGSLGEKADYKRLLGYLSKARKAFYNGWTPYTLADDTRGPILLQRTGYYGLHLRGLGFNDTNAWLEAIKQQLNCPLKRWEGQQYYVEVWFEAAAMQGQFLHYVNENVPLLAFHGDVSIPEKWEAAQRLRRRSRDLNVPVKVLYYGDYDPKGLQIPESAREDVKDFMGFGLVDFEFIRVGLNDDHPGQYNIPENPERPGTYQWEGLNDDAAQELIAQVDDFLDMDAFQQVADKEDNITQRFRDYLTTLEFLECPGCPQVFTTEDGRDEHMIEEGHGS